MISDYFDNEWGVRDEFTKEFISIWSGWLGQENYHQLDEVTEHEWTRFNTLIKLLHHDYELFSINLESNTVEKIRSIDLFLATYHEDMNRTSTEFSRIIIPALNAILTEDWDYTYILWHRNNGAKEALAPLIKKAELFQFSASE
jgi:hypothetical protein